MPEERRSVMRVMRGDKLVSLGDRLDVIEKRLNIQTIILTVLVVDHIGTLPLIWNLVVKLFGL
jgi:hypothetical protein